MAISETYNTSAPNEGIVSFGSINRSKKSLSCTTALSFASFIAQQHRP